MTAISHTLGAPKAQIEARYLYSPIIDFLLLGGGSLLVLPALAIVFPAPQRPEILVATGLILAHFINHPHFAHSYQIFYRGYPRKLSSPELPASLRIRYLVSGALVPLAMAAFFVLAVGMSDLRLLGLAANLMLLLVGWHYVKQGYGMLIVDSVLKRRFFAPRQKTLLLVNSYVVWAFAWTKANAAIAQQDYWNVKYYSFALPEWLLTAVTVMMIASTSIAVVVLLRDIATRPGPRPWNGIVAYFTTLYLWTAFVSWNPAMLLLVPAFHSLQYLAVVWRFKANAIWEAAGASEEPQPRFLGWPMPKVDTIRFVNFSLMGLLLGFLGFWGVPLVLDGWVAYDESVFGPTLFVFVFWLFINVHHYFLDSVMWRAENPEVRRNLFSAR